MDQKQVEDILDKKPVGWDYVTRLNVSEPERALSNLASIAEAGVTLDLMGAMLEQLDARLSSLADPDQALNSLERFVTSSRSPLAFGALVERDPSALSTLLQLFGTSQHLADLLISDPDSFELVRLTDGKPVARRQLVDEICREVSSLQEERQVMAAIRRFKRRETLRVAYGDIVGQQSIEAITRQISYVAEATCEAAVRFARRRCEERYGRPVTHGGQEAKFVVLALGKLGGAELNYSSDIDLIMLFDGEGETSGRRKRSNAEFFDHLVRDFTRLLTESTELGIAYRVDLRLRPNGSQGPLVNTLDSAWHYYDVAGRTWERQAFVKARAIAGDLEFGEKFLLRMQGWIYRRYLSRADITGIKALKRRIEHRAHSDGVDDRNVKTGWGGIRDIEFVIQFLQLLNGGDLPDIRTTNTLDAIRRLEGAGCLTHQERGILEENYAFLRKVEHRLQIMFDLQTHTLPDSKQALASFAIRMGYETTTEHSALNAFQSELQDRTDLNRKILDHLLHDAFAEDEQAGPEVDLILEPDPSDERIQSVLSPYGFRDIPAAYHNLSTLAMERIPFLSTRRCRHFLASIGSRLLNAISETPDPDQTLISLSQVSDSLGGKGVLWELFSFNPPSLQLYVTLCASSPYLAGILTSNPGMIDELMDSLMLERLPTKESLEATLKELCHGAEDIDPILHSFKNSQHLRVGVRDILGKEDVRETHQALSDIAEVCLTRVATEELRMLVAKHGEPRLEDGEACELVILALGKLGGREPNYHSDLDVVFIYTGTGSTHARQAEKVTSNQHFYSQLATKIIKRISGMGPHGRLYELDPRLRPTGRSGALAVSMAEFLKYFEEGAGQSWERQALCKARIVFGSAESQHEMDRIVRQAIFSEPWTAERAQEIRAMRLRLEESASANNLKRGRGGTVDVEFVVQMLQLRHGAQCPQVMVPKTLEALDRLQEHGFLALEERIFLSEAYRFLRSVEARLRLMNTTARHDMPEDQAELRKLAYLLGYPSDTLLQSDVLDYREKNRSHFERIFAAAERGLAV